MKILLKKHTIIFFLNTKKKLIKAWTNKLTCRYKEREIIRNQLTLKILDFENLIFEIVSVSLNHSINEYFWHVELIIYLGIQPLPR